MTGADVQLCVMIIADAPTPPKYRRRQTNLGYRSRSYRLS